MIGHIVLPIVASALVAAAVLRFAYWVSDVDVEYETRPSTKLKAKFEDYES